VSGRGGGLACDAGANGGERKRGGLPFGFAQGKKSRPYTERGKCGGHGLVVEWVVASQVQLIA